VLSSLRYCSSSSCRWRWWRGWWRDGHNYSLGWVVFVGCLCSLYSSCLGSRHGHCHQNLVKSASPPSAFVQNPYIFPHRRWDVVIVIVITIAFVSRGRWRRCWLELSSLSSLVRAEDIVNRCWSWYALKAIQLLRAVQRCFSHHDVIHRNPPLTKSRNRHCNHNDQVVGGGGPSQASCRSASTNNI